MSLSIDFNHSRLRGSRHKEPGNGSPSVAYSECDKTHFDSMLLGSLDVGRVIFFRTLTQLERGLANFLSLNLPGLFEKALERKAASWNKFLDLGELVEVWSDGTGGDYPVSSAGAAICQKAHNKQKSFISIVRKLRNSFAHGGVFLPSALKRIIHAATKLLQACSLSHLQTSVSNIRHLFSQRKEEWSTAQWLLSLLQNEEPLIKSRSFRSTAHNPFGRDDLISDLVQALTNKVDLHRDCQWHRILLHGPHGVGKTVVIRQLSKQLAQHFPRQGFFQASSKEALLSDCQLFLSSQGCSAQGMNDFRKFLQTSDSLLLVFEDVVDQLSVLSLLPEGRHSVIFTSASDLPWAKQGLFNGRFAAIKMNDLSTGDSLLVMERVFIDCRKHDLFQDYMHGALSKRRIVSTLDEDLKNIPLAVRLFSYQLAQGPMSLRGPWQPEWPYVTGTERSEEDQHAAGCLHVRGFHHAVRSSLEVLSENVAARQLCFACSLLPKSCIQVWFLQLVGEELGLSHHETNNAVFTLISLGLLTKEATGPESDRVVRQHCIVQCHLRQIMTKSGKKLSSFISCLVQKAVRKKLSCLWRNQEFSVHAQGRNGNALSRDERANLDRLDIGECVYLTDIISSILRHAKEIHLEYSDFSKLRLNFYLLKEYCGSTWDYFKWANDYSLWQNYLHYWNRDFCQSIDPASTATDNLPAVFSGWHLISPRQTINTAIPLLTSQEKECDEFNDNLLDRVALVLSKHDRQLHIQKILLSLRLTPDDLLCRYLLSGNFACLSILLRLCFPHCNSCNEVEFCERLFHKVFNAWLTKGYEKGFWWEASDVCCVGRNLARILRSAGRPRRALFWCEVIFLVVTDMKNAIQPFFFSMRIITLALHCCITSPPEDHSDFFKWFRRFYRVKASLQSMPPGRQGNKFVLRSLASAWVYLDRYVEQSDGILLAITHDLVAMATEEMNAFLDEYCHGRHVSIRALIVIALSIAPERNPLELVQRLMKTLISSLDHCPVKCSGLLEFPNQLTNLLHKEYFSLSRNEKCFLVEFFTSAVPTMLDKVDNIQCDIIKLKTPESRPVEFGDDHQGTCEAINSSQLLVKSEISKVFEHCLRSILPRAIINHAGSMCSLCFWRIEENSRLMP